MGQTAPQLVCKTLSKANLPDRVYRICDALLQASSDFFEHGLQKLLNEFEQELISDTEHQHSKEVFAGVFSNLHTFRSTKYDFIPQFMSVVEQQLANLRNTKQVQLLAQDLQLLEHHHFDFEQFQLQIAIRCESQHSFDLFLLNQRMAVLAGHAAFSNESLPLSPNALLNCLKEAITSMSLDAAHAQHICFLFERHVLSNYATLLQACNKVLIEQGVLPNLSYVPFRNPELRIKRSPFALRKIEAEAAPSQLVDYAKQLRKAEPSMPSQTELPAATPPNIDTSQIEESFSQLRQLMARKKQVIKKLNALTENYANESVADDTTISAPAKPASANQINEILQQLQQKNTQPNNVPVKIQDIKLDMLAKLRNLSNAQQEYNLSAEDNDAIDLIALIMNQAMRQVDPKASVAKLISLMNMPLIQVVMRDKSFFSNHAHPARQMLNVLAETGFNWIDESDTDTRFNQRLIQDMNSAIQPITGEYQEIILAHQKTQQLLQTLIKKAEATEQRQIETARGKEKLVIAREHAKNLLGTLLAGKRVSTGVRAILQHAWFDVLSLTAVREGTHSSAWNENVRIAEQIIDLQQNKHALDSEQIKDFTRQFSNALSQVGYPISEAELMAETIVHSTHGSPLKAQWQYPETSQFGRALPAGNQATFHLNDKQSQIFEKINILPIGTWFEFKNSNTIGFTRQKMAWVSTISREVLFVNQRGQKISDMPMQELAIRIEAGSARIQQENPSTLFERAFATILSSLRSFIPQSTGKSL